MRASLWVAGILAAFFVGLVVFGIGFTRRGGPLQRFGEASQTAHPDSYQDMVSPDASPTANLSPTSLLNPVPPTITGERAYRVPILLYHYISTANKGDTGRMGLSTPPGVLDQQLSLLSQRGFTAISLDELGAAFSGVFILPAKPVILTFDDGYEDFYTNAAPLLKKYSMKGIAFIPTGLMGGGAYMTWAQVEELAKSPNVVFGAHSIHHYSLPHVSEKILKEEVIDSKRILESHVGYKINWFCYPYGSFDDRVVDMVRGAGYVGATTTLPGAWHYQSRMFYMPRYRAGTRTGESFLKLVE